MVLEETVLALAIRTEEMAKEFQLKHSHGLPGSLSWFESHSLSGPQFPFVQGGGRL